MFPESRTHAGTSPTGRATATTVLFSAEPLVGQENLASLEIECLEVSRSPNRQKEAAFSEKRDDWEWESRGKGSSESLVSSRARQTDWTHLSRAVPSTAACCCIKADRGYKVRASESGGSIDPSENVKVPKMRFCSRGRGEKLNVKAVSGRSG